MAKLFVIIPVYNEAGNIGGVLQQINDLVSAHQLETEIVIVNDGSRDSTVEEIGAAHSAVPVKLIHHETNRGIPKTFFDGLSYAAARTADDDCVCMIEGDGTSDILQIPAMMAKVASGADVVVASRVIAGGAFLRFPWFRKLGSLIVNYFVRFFARVKGVTDYTIFFRAYRARCLKQAIHQHHEQFIVTKSFAANLEVLLKLQPYIQQVAEVPLVYDYGLKKGKSKMKLFKTLREYAQLLWKIKYSQHS